MWSVSRPVVVIVACALLAALLWESWPQILYALILPGAGLVAWIESLPPPLFEPINSVLGLFDADGGAESVLFVFLWVSSMAFWVALIASGAWLLRRLRHRYSGGAL